MPGIKINYELSIIYLAIPKLPGFSLPQRRNKPACRLPTGIQAGTSQSRRRLLPNILYAITYKRSIKIHD